MTNHRISLCLCRPRSSRHEGGKCQESISIIGIDRMWTYVTVFLVFWFKAYTKHADHSPTCTKCSDNYQDVLKHFKLWCQFHWLPLTSTRLDYAADQDVSLLIMSWWSCKRETWSFVSRVSRSCWRSFIESSQWAEAMWYAEIWL